MRTLPIHRIIEQIDSGTGRVAWLVSRHASFRNHELSLGGRKIKAEPATGWQLNRRARMDDRNFDIDALSRALREVRDALPTGPVDKKALTVRKLNSVRKSAQDLHNRLPGVIAELDPVATYPLLDPGDPKVAARYLASMLEDQTLRPLADLDRFWGAGVYALYYRGNHPAYSGISGQGIPIYIGKADPKDPQARTAHDQGDKLYQRLQDHASSIRDAEQWAESGNNTDGVPAIRLRDFDVRFLVLSSAYAGAIEENLIRSVMPVWNKETKICFGIGKHGDLPATRTNTRSPWDTLHPGRTWALLDDNVPHEKTWQEISADVQRYIQDRYGTP